MLKSKLQICLNVLTHLSVYILLVAACSISNSSEERKWVDPVKYPDLVDQVWLTKDTQCSAPCWRGLELGISSQSESVNLVQSLPFVESGRELNNASGNFIVPCKSPPDEYCLAMEFENEVLSSLWLYPNYRITFEQVVDNLGPPDSFYYVRRDAERKGCSLYVLWIKRQLVVGYGDPPIYSGDDLCDRFYESDNKFVRGILAGSVHYITSDRMSEIVEIAPQSGTGNTYVIWDGFADN